MKYFIDTEFIEGFHKPLFGKRRHFIDLISIGIFCEDGREYYAISNEFNPKDADDWVNENVINKLERKFIYSNPNIQQKNPVYKSNNQIAKEIVEFICPYETASEWAGAGSLSSGLEGFLKMNPPEFYAYYADYDWVLFCSLFGRMIDLPKGFPMYCKDLKQTLDELAENRIMNVENKQERESRFESSLNEIKCNPHYPKHKNEHNALDDAMWNYELYKFLLKFK